MSEASLPTGTVTFLFTDIEASTRLLQQLPDQYAGLLAEQREILRAAFEKYNGREVDTAGDAFFVAFQRASDTLNAAVESQRALAAHHWPAAANVRVRMGLHTGEPQVTASGYIGMEVHRAARIAAAAYGGQVLLSQTTHDLIENALPEGVTLRDLGEHRLKDLRRPKRLFQLVIPGVPSEFPRLKTLDALPNNLPIQLTNFIGRERELADVKRVLSNVRLLTLTGPGGSGKTRLSLQIAADLLEDFADGVWFVELAPLSDATLVDQTIATTLGVREEAGRTITTTLTDFLHSKCLLLILDNCEHLVEACARLAERLLRSCPAIKILASSREPLGIAGEMPWRVPPLALPNPGDSSLASLSENEAVRLFVDRATTIQPNFTLTEQNASAVAEICARLDGIPLAIELAAARVKVLPVQQIAKRLDDRFRLLTGGSRTSLPRQQTLRALIDWSYDLLSDEERVLLQRLSVFAGGWTLEAAEQVSSEQVTSDDEKPLSSLTRHPSPVTLDLMSRVVDKSLVIAEEQDGEARYRMLETIRQYAFEKLVAAEQESIIRNRHLDYFVAFIEDVDPKLRDAEQADWLARLDRDYDNLRAALEWSAKQNNIEADLRLASALWRFWRVRSYFNEGRRWLEDALARSRNAPVPLRVGALLGAGSLANYQADYDHARVILAESLQLSRELDDKHAIATTLNLLAHASMMQGSIQDAETMLEESLAIFQELGDKRGIAYALYFIGSMWMALGRLESARPLLEEGLALLKEVGDKWWIGNTLIQLGWTINRQGEHERARSMFDEALEIARAFGDTRGIARALMYVAEAKLAQGEYEGARQKYLDSLQLLQKIGDKWWCTVCLENLGVIAALQGQPRRAAQLFGASERMHELLSAPMLTPYREHYEHALAQARAELDEQEFAAAWANGRALTLEQAIELAISNEG